MAGRENALREALSELEEQRAKNLLEEQRRRNEALEKCPKVRELLAGRQAMLTQGMKRAFADPARAQELSQEMSRGMEALNLSLRQELKAGGFPEDYLQPVYRCALCRDTGYVGEPVHEQCSCLKRMVMRKLCSDEGLRVLEKENFSTFREDIFPDVPVEGHRSTQRGYVHKLRAAVEKYADEFNAETRQGILLCGRSGLGKSFFMNCAAERVLERGFSVVIISAYRLLETMRRWQFDGTDGETVQNLLGCDLLCLDDLGSEPMLRSVTVSSVYHVVNERRSAGKPMIVTTNCAPTELYEKYDDRVAARLTDPGYMKVIELFGQDVRKTARLAD